MSFQRKQHLRAGKSASEKKRTRALAALTVTLGEFFRRCEGHRAVVVNLGWVNPRNERHGIEFVVEAKDGHLTFDDNEAIEQLAIGIANGLDEIERPSLIVAPLGLGPDRIH